MNVRPFARSFLEKMSKLFDICIFTAAEKNYAEKIIKLIDPSKQFTKYRFYR